MDRDTVREIVASVTPERCEELAVRLVDIPSLTGNEQPIAECVHGILAEMGAETYMQEFEPGRYNAIGRLRGQGRGATLLLNGHIDIAFNGTESYLPKAPPPGDSMVSTSPGWTWNCTAPARDSMLPSARQSVLRPSAPHWPPATP